MCIKKQILNLKDYLYNVNIDYTDNVLYNIYKYKTIAKITIFVHKEHLLIYLKGGN